MIRESDRRSQSAATRELGFQTVASVNVHVGMSIAHAGGQLAGGQGKQDAGVKGLGPGNATVHDRGLASARRPKASNDLAVLLRPLPQLFGGCFVGASLCGKRLVHGLVNKGG